MVLLFKRIAPPSQFPATIASGAPPRPNHAVFKAELVYVSKPFGGARGGEGVCLTLAFLGGHKWAEMLHNPCILGDPQQRGQHQSTRKNKKKKEKIFHLVPDPIWGLADCPHWELNP